MLIEAALFPRNLLNEGSKIHNFIVCLCELLGFNFIMVTVPEINYGFRFRSAKAKSYGSYGSGSGSGSAALRTGICDLGEQRLPPEKHGWPLRKSALRTRTQSLHRKNTTHSDFYFLCGWEFFFYDQRYFLEIFYCRVTRVDLLN